MRSYSRLTWQKKETNPKMKKRTKSSVERKVTP
jgi:hypothetical protein